MQTKTTKTIDTIRYSEKESYILACLECVFGTLSMWAKSLYYNLIKLKMQLFSRKSLTINLTKFRYSMN